MSNINIVVAYSRPWSNILSELIVQNPNIKFYSIKSDVQLTKPYLKKINPKYIFFPHWSNLIPSEIFGSYNCVIFHMTDLPFGRGGSPLQNLIASGIYETKISAIQCVEKLDAGPVYMKKPLSLHGNAEEIYLRASSIITEMITEIIKYDPKPVEQAGEIVEFKRRKPHEGNISELETLEQIYDYIRMLDAEGYPKAFIETGNFVFEFERSALKDGEIHADVKISLKEVDRD